MQVRDLPMDSLANSYRPASIANPTLSTLIAELGVECQRAITLLHQLQLPNLSDCQKIDLLAEPNASVVHLQSHCDDRLQELIADELESIELWLECGSKVGEHDNVEVWNWYHPDNKRWRTYDGFMNDTERAQNAPRGSFPKMRAYV